jgi:hypothetical protein
MLKRLLTTSVVFALGSSDPVTGQILKGREPVPGRHWSVNRVRNSTTEIRHSTFAIFPGLEIQYFFFARACCRLKLQGLWNAATGFILFRLIRNLCLFPISVRLRVRHHILYMLDGARLNAKETWVTDVKHPLTLPRQASAVSLWMHVIMQHSFEIQREMFIMRINVLCGIVPSLMIFCCALQVLRLIQPTFN